jgi:hypothetical protein
MIVRLFGSLRKHVYRHVFAAKLAFMESHNAFRSREQGVILAHANVGTSMEAGAALTHDDVAADHILAAELLHTKATTR